MINSINRRLILLFTIISSFAYGQDSTAVSDFELWSGLSVKKSFLDKKLDLELTQEFRFDDNSTRLDNFFTELGGSYEIIKGLSAGVGYRFIRNVKNSGSINENRFNIDVQYKHKVDRLKLDYRFRYQNRRELGVSREDGNYPTSKYRLRLKANYNIKNWKLDPYISAEGFYALETNSFNYVESITETEDVSGFEKLRFTLGTKYQLKKWLSIGAYYRIEREFKSYPLVYNTPGTFYIAGANLKFTL